MSDYLSSGLILKQLGEPSLRPEGMGYLLYKGNILKSDHHKV